MSERPIVRQRVAGACDVCLHADRKAVEEALIATPERAGLADLTGIGLDTLRRHETQCMRRIAAKEPYESELQRIDTTAAALRVMSEAARLGKKAEKRKDLRTALLALREYARGAALVTEMQHAAKVEAHVERDARWIALRDAILRALEPHPEAQRAVMSAIASVRGPS